MLVLHTALGVAAVGTATHLVIWLRRYVRGQFALARAVKKFAVVSLVLHALAFLAGNVMYPTYKVEVRAAYLDNAAAILDEHARTTREIERIAAREGVSAPEPDPG